MNKCLFLSALLGLLLWACNDDPLQPELYGNIRGIVQEADGTPIVGAQVSTNPATVSVETDSLGEFAIDSILVRNYSIVAQKEGFRDRTQTVELTDEETVNVTLTMTEQTENNDPPSVPTLLEPSDDATDVERSPILRWTASDPEEDALTYTVQVFSSVDTTTFIQTTTDTFLQVPNLRLETSYLWTVSADDGNNPPVTSTVQRFTTKEFPDYRIHVVKEDTITGNLVIYAAEEPVLDGSGNAQDSLELIPLTDPGVNSWRPHLNPQRNRVAFISNRNGENHLFLMDRNGDNVEQLSSDARPISGGFNVYDLNYAWEPNGERIIYPSNNRLYWINISTRSTVQYAQAEPGFDFVEVDIALSNDPIAVDPYFVLARQEGEDRYDTRILLYNPSLQSNVLLDANDSLIRGQLAGPIFSPGDNLMVYSEDQQTGTNFDQIPRDAVLFQSNYQGNPLTSKEALPVGDKAADTNDLYPAFSPGGQRLLLANTPNDTRNPIGNIFLVDLTGGGSGEVRELAYPNATMPDWQ
jgi:hypothetical protein